jgi:hypothetical protein
MLLIWKFYLFKQQQLGDTLMTAPTVTVTIDSQDWMTWVKARYEAYVDYLEHYNRNRHAWRGPAVIDNFDEWCDANGEEIQQKYHAYLEDL